MKFNSLRLLLTAYALTLVGCGTQSIYQSVNNSRFEYDHAACEAWGRHKMNEYLLEYVNNESMNSTQKSKRKIRQRYARSYLEDNYDSCMEDRGYIKDSGSDS